MQNLSSTEHKIRLLVCAQIVDENDAVLGFFHGWLKEFTHHFSSISVVCLKKGKYTLPQSVNVFSLGKEKKESRLRYMYNFYHIIIGQRATYDAVFVHMNKEYVILGFLVWKILGKKVILWYNHPIATWTARIAARLADEVMYTSPTSYFGRNLIGKKMPVGTDTESFNLNHRVPRGMTILSLGRIAPVKNTLLIVQAFGELLKKGIRAHLIIAGEATEEDAVYRGRVMSALQSFKEHVTLLGAVPHHTAPELFASADVFVNLTPSGSLDKAIFEAEASGCVVVTSNDYAASLFPDHLRTKLFIDSLSTTDDHSQVAQALEYALTLSDEDRSLYQNHMRANVIQDHGLQRLARDIASAFHAVY